MFGTGKSRDYLRVFVRQLAGTIIGLQGCLVVGLRAQTPVLVGDGSFEANSLSIGQFSTNLEPEWKETGGPGSGSGFEERISGFVSEGVDHLGMENGHDVWQDLVVVYEADSLYTLTVAVGNRQGQTTAGNQSRYHLADANGVMYGTGEMDASLIAEQSFVDAPVLVLNTSQTPSAVGKTIRILLQARGQGRSHFDHIRLTVQRLIPEGGAVMGNLYATPITPQATTLGGEVLDIGDGEPSITVFFGEQDGGQSPDAWANHIALPGLYSGTFSVEVDGLTPGTSYRYVFRATNSAGSSWTGSEGWETPPLPPEVTMQPVLLPSAISAHVAATVFPEFSESSVTFYYGMTDGGTSVGAWDASATVDAVTTNVMVLVSGLNPGTVYYVRAFAVNAGGESWAPSSVQFATPMIEVPVVSNRSASGITGTTATLRGDVEDTGGDIPLITIFYGSTDGGTEPSAWASSIAAGRQSGIYSFFVTGLQPQTSYFFRSRASNLAGTNWATSTFSFDTNALIPAGVVINEFNYKPSDKTNFDEFIELFNPGDIAQDLSGWRLTDAVSFTFPPGTVVGPGAYLVVGENPSSLNESYGVAALGPWTGKLSSKGERINLVDTSGLVRDRVDYGVGFPWPTASDGAGASAELIHPSLDNDLAGSWRSSGTVLGEPPTYIAAGSSGWNYKKGTAEASSPVDAWRDPSYNDATWSQGSLPLGYGITGVNTTLSDMRRRTGVAGYSSVYLRKAFTVSTDDIPNRLRLRMRIDDGCVIWINGVEVARRNVAAGQLAYSYVAPSAHSYTTWHEVIIENADVLLYGGSNVLTLHGFNVSLTSSDFFVDVELLADSPSPSPTPGQPNSVMRDIGSIPPQIRQVAHTPAHPKTGEEVLISARITDPDGMGPVYLLYQRVEPGAYIRRTDAAYASVWTSIPMRDEGTGGDAVAGDSVFTVKMPAAVQVHRHLVRYRITFEDALGNAAVVPYADDEQPNFAYWVYDGVPAWTGAIRPTAYNGFPATDPITFPASLMNSMQTVHVISNDADINNSQYNGSFANTRFWGTVVQGDKVYDHVQYRVRGIGSTYVSGKNKWNIYFNRARDYQGYDNYGKPYAETWNNLLINANASPWAAVHRGSTGIEESLSARAFQLAGLPAQHTQYFQLRVVDEAIEASPTSQYVGDLWGVYLGLEPTEGNFLDERGMEEGNLYAIEGNNGDKKYQGPTHPIDSSDWNSFRDGLATSNQTEQWYRDNVDLPALYSFLAMNRLLGNVDVRPGDNYRFYHRPSDGRWVIIPYDLDMMFIPAHHWGGTMDGVVVAGAPNVIRAVMRHPALAREYRNRCRELLSLIASDASPNGAQIGQLVDEYAQFVHAPGTAPSWAMLDAAMWNLHPRTNGSGANSGQSSHKGNFFRALYLDGPRGGLAGTAQTGSWVRTLPDSDGDSFADHPSIAQWFVNYATATWPGGTWNRKAMTGIGTGTDSDPHRQAGYGYKYLEFESQHGGHANSLVNPGSPPDLDFPNTPVLSAVGASEFPVDDLRFSVSEFSDPQGPSTHAATQWRLAEIAAPGIPGYVANTPRKYEIEETWSQLVSAPSAAGEMAVPLGVALPGKTYRLRVRHQDTTGRWSFWSPPVSFTAGAPAPTTLLHYWNFNTSGTLLAPTLTIGGGAIISTLGSGSEVIDGSGQNFTGINARGGDVAGSHLRINLPLLVQLDWAIPTTNHDNIMVAYEARRSGQGAGLQLASYTIDGLTFTPFATWQVPDGDPILVSLDFRTTPGVANNPLFAVRIQFLQGEGGTAGNNRIDNFTVEGNSLLPSQPVFLPGGTAIWNEAGHWAHASIPNAPGDQAIINAPASANREVRITAPVTIGNLVINNADSPFRNRIASEPGGAFVFDGNAASASLTVQGIGTGFVELEIVGGTTLATDLMIHTSNIDGDPTHGALRLRETWSGSGGIHKTGAGMASMTGSGKNFTGPIVVEEGVLQITQPAAPGQVQGITVLPGGQLRLNSANDEFGARIYTFGGSLSLAGQGRGSEIPDAENRGVLGALRYEPGAGTNRAVVASAVHLPADADIHANGLGNTLELAGTITGSGRMSKTGGGPLRITSNAPAYSGTIDIINGPLQLAGNVPLAPVALALGTTLEGHGHVATISGLGAVILRDTLLVSSSLFVPEVSVMLTRSGAPDTTQPANAGNGLLVLVGTSPLPVAPARLDLYLDLPDALPGDRLRGGIFTPQTFALANALSTTQVRLLLPDPTGNITYFNRTWRASTSQDTLSWAVVPAVISVNGVPTSGSLVEVLVGGEPTGYAQWRGLHWADPTERANDTISGPSALGPEGISHLVRYSMGLPPTASTAGRLPTLQKSPTGYSYLFHYNPSLTDLRWRVLASPDLSDWSFVVHDTATDGPPPPHTGWFSATLPAPNSFPLGPQPAPRLYLKLELLLSP